MQVIDLDTGLKFWLDNTDELSADLSGFIASNCNHRVTEVRRRVHGGGGFHFFAQCCECGRAVGLARKKITVPDSAPDWNADAEGRYNTARETMRANILQKHVRIQREGIDGFEREYSKYLKSDAWAQRRAKVLKRAGGICEGCLENKATQVHHKTYDNVFEEFMFELIAVCDDCHQRLHPEKNLVVVESGDADVAVVSEWMDGLACEGCRHGSEQHGRPWCFILEQYSVDALSDVGDCGPLRSSFEPLR